MLNYENQFFHISFVFQPFYQYSNYHGRSILSLPIVLLLVLKIFVCFSKAFPNGE